MKLTDTINASSTARSLAHAALKIATANHYMVGLVEIDGIGPADYADAKRLLIDTENDLGRMSARFDIAHDVLSHACDRNHGRGCC